MRLKDLKTTPVYDSYWSFATSRQEVFFNRLHNKEFPWTKDPIICKYKFTNAYRASDRVSQYLIKNVIYSEEKFTPEDVCFRILFFKLFNKIETWEYMQKELGSISYSNYKYDNYNRLLIKRLEEKERIYSAAYIMPSGKSCFGHEKKHQNNLKLLEYIMGSGLTKRISSAKSLKKLYEVLLEYPTLGIFLAFQFAIDLNYSELCDFSEMSFVIAGPGAKNGIQKCFREIDRYSYEDIICFVTEEQEAEFEKRNLVFKSLFGRQLQLIDCQNLFCETDKYARVAYPEITGKDIRKRIKQQYVNKELDEIHFFYPPKWGINDKIK